MQQRTNVITGARSGIGRATMDLLRARGERVIGVDLADSEVDADLSTLSGRTLAASRIATICPNGIDTIVACAGLSTSDGPAMVSVNYFGAVDLVTSLRPLLARSDSARAVIVSSSASFLPFDEQIVEACLNGDEHRARQLATSGDEAEATARLDPIYSASKRAVSQWIRRTAPREEWAGAGILLNGVAPGLVKTPMTAELLESPDHREYLARIVPRAVTNPAEAEDVALLLAFLVSADNRYLVGQVPFCDGGTEVIMRGDAFY